MHHKIYLVVQAANGVDAMDTAIAHIEDWGTENNWRSAIGAISQKGTKILAGIQESSLKGYSIKRINKLFQKKIDKPQPEWTQVREIKPFVQKLVEGNFSGEIIQMLAADNDRFWAFKQFAHEIYASYQHAKYHAGESFDVFKHEYRPYDYDEFSVTHLDVDEDAKGKLFCVIVDMHT